MDRLCSMRNCKKFSWEKEINFSLNVRVDMENSTIKTIATYNVGT